jgi:UDP-N-acetylglucosamine 2-epimerase (non-hydrolysing)
VACIFGTRPEAIKMAPVIQELARAGDVEPVTVVTAQHRELLDRVLGHFGIEPAADLDVMVPGQSLTHTTTRVLERLEPVLARLKPDLVLVHGDTTTTLAAALAAFYARIPVGHVEAGLRTGDKYAPYPEEMNRRLTDAVADLHFAPTPRARDNLRREGVPDETVFVTGNTAIDALLRTVRPGRRDGRVLLVEAHRRENFGGPLEQVALAIRDVARRFPDLRVVCSVHPNPNVRGVFRQVLSSEPNVELHDPFDYVEWAQQMARAYLIATDSGGVQEEAPALGTPVVLLRDKTERPEAVEAGTVLVAGTDRARVAEVITWLLQDGEAHRRMEGARNPFGDGHAAERIVAAIRHRLGLSAEPPPQWEPERPGGSASGG